MLRDLVAKRDHNPLLTDSKSSISFGQDKIRDESSSSINYLLESVESEKQEPPNILVIDDEPMNVLVFQNLLAQEGLTVDVSQSGYEGIQYVQDRVIKVEKGEAQMYKVIFLDYSMPDLDGP